MENYIRISPTNMWIDPKVGWWPTAIRGFVQSSGDEHPLLHRAMSKYVVQMDEVAMNKWGCLKIRKAKFQVSSLCLASKLFKMAGF